MKVESKRKRQIAGQFNFLRGKCKNKSVKTEKIKDMFDGLEFPSRYSSILHLELMLLKIQDNNINTAQEAQDIIIQRIVSIYERAQADGNT
jgi:hypothetical protein